jgi:dihydrolipoamide dehydrogenase
MSETREIKVPDIGDFDDVDVVEVLVAAGDEVKVDDPLITLESDKASMEVPATVAGTVDEVKVKVGDKVGAGDVIVAVTAAKGEEEEPEREDGAAKDREKEEDEEREDEGDGEERAAATRRRGPERREPEEQRPPPKRREPGRDEPERKEPERDRPERKEPPDEKRKRRDEKGAAKERHDYDFDVVVLGSGPGGYTAAFRAADLGQRTALVERYSTLGGVCLNVGCIPSKALLHAAKVVDEAAFFSAHGLAFGQPEIDLYRLRKWKQGVVDRLTGGLDTLARRRKVEVVRGSGRFSGPHELTVEGEEGERRLTFARAIVAAGSRAVKLPFLPEDDERIMDSSAALEIDDVPDRLLVIGGGIIGLELATVFDALGSRVTVVELMDRLMPGTDADLVKPLYRHIAERYESIFLSTKVTAVEAGEDGLRVSFEGEGAPEQDRFDRILVAVGRRPNGDRIGAEAAGLDVDESGFVAVDEQMRTNVEHIFAIGDVAGHPMLAHKATHEGKVAAEVAAGEKSGFDARVIPSVAYTDPEVAWVGVTEEQARERDLAYGKASCPWAVSGRALALDSAGGLTKLLFDEESGRLIGAGIVGVSAGDLIAECTLAIEMGADAADVGLFIHPHPTLSETVAFAAEAYEGTVTDLYLPKRKSGGRR